MKKVLKIALTIVCVLALAWGILVYIDHKQRENMDNFPYEPDWPAPAAHTGLFTSDHGTMLFNGDGKTLVYDFDERLAELTGLPQGKNEATYVFLTGNLPPHGSMETRYDVAHELKISVRGKAEVVLDVAIANPDGKTAIAGTNIVTEERIPLLFYEDRYFSVIFEKTETEK